MGRAGDELAALGRLVQVGEGALELGGMYVLSDYRGSGVARQIVTRLLTRASIVDVIYCIPFAQLESFYTSCGFTRCEMTGDVPRLVRDKVEWCASTYDEPVVLM